MDELIPYLPYLAPYLLVSFSLSIIALVHVLKHRSFRFGNVFLWVVIVLLLQIIGPIGYFLVGKEEDV
ncbi:PLDc N-terminal domain-containing protein [Enterococcus sp. BWR-S5]|uniref:PLDc N-terminal domain-containing protein n=1 Tax=Enterococcus sp. BWR-S5 TaxID=2787714 RepID=UPI001924F351|nr:PLD nuclease N-terminal domain-containing protein [Enterococcus sp. BWR-S5]MBL1226433.1 PLDc_N domain-containing protein [Enterococcus sp. BWR-S5]